MTAIIINANRTGYTAGQIDRTLTVGELIEILSQYDEETPVMVGNDPQRNGGWYTYGGINPEDIAECEEEEENDEC
jgi:hypothetical protein